MLQKQNRSRVKLQSPAETLDKEGDAVSSIFSDGKVGFLKRDGIDYLVSSDYMT